MKKLINFYQKLTFLQGTAFAISLLTVAGISAHSLTPFNIFTPGQTISSAAVNENFNTLGDAIEASSTMTYLGVWDATTTLPSATNIGDYYIVSVASPPFDINDKIIWNSSSFDQVAAEHYWTKTGNDIAYSIGNVNVSQKLRLKDTSVNYVEVKAPTTISSTYTFTLPSNPGTSGKVLSTDGTGVTSWVTMNDPNVQSFASSALPTCTLGEVLKSNGSSFLCVTDNAGSPFSGAMNRAMATDGLGVLTTSNTTSTELGYLSGVTSSIQGQLNNTLSTTGGTLSVGTITGVPTPIGNSDVVNKLYVDNSMIWTKSGSDTYYQSGKVGIGTSSPGAALEIVGTSSNSAVIIPRDSTVNRPTGVAGMLRFNSTTNDLEFYNSTTWMTISTVSDARLKTNIMNVDNGLEIVNKLRPVFFDWDQNSERARSYGTKHQVGFIAQEVEKYLPEVVTKANDTFRTLDYGKIVSVVVSATQSLSNKIDALEAKYSSTDNEIELIKEENKMMKHYLCSRDPQAPFCE